MEFASKQGLRTLEAPPGQLWVGSGGPHPAAGLLLGTWGCW